MMRAYLASYCLGISNISALIPRLNDDPALRRAAGFAGGLPSYATFWRLFDPTGRDAGTYRPVL